MKNWTPEEQKAIDKAMENIGNYGADRVLTSGRGTSVPFSYAVDEFGIEVELVFIRNDGWTLGCHRNHQSVAYQMWKDEWIAILIKPESTPRHIEDALEMGMEIQRILGKIRSTPKSLKRPRPGGVKGVWSYVGQEGPEEIKKQDSPE